MLDAELRIWDRKFNQIFHSGGQGPNTIAVDKMSEIPYLRLAKCALLAVNVDAINCKKLKKFSKMFLVSVW